MINFFKSHTLTYQLISRITPPKVIPELIKSIFKKERLINNYDENEKKLLSISNREIDNMSFMTNRDYAYLYSAIEFDKWGKNAIDKSLINLDKIIQISKDKNININILYLYEPILLLKKPIKKQLDYLITGLKNLEKKNIKVNFIKDIYSGYDNGYDAYKNLFFINDIHWNKRGNAKVAKEILSKIDFD